MKTKKESASRFPVFSERLNALRGTKSRQAVAKDLNITRQSLEYYEKGERLPDAQMIAEIAKYYKVSSDYLLGLTDKPTNDKDLTAVADYMGLSTECVQKVKLELNQAKNINEIVDLIISSPMFWNIVSNSYDLLSNSKEIYHYLNEITNDISTIAKILEVEPQKLIVYLGNNKKIHSHSPVDYRGKSDIARYNNFKNVEDLSDVFDIRKYMSSENKEKLLKLLSIDESDLEAMKAGD